MIYLDNVVVVLNGISRVVQYKLCNFPEKCISSIRSVSENNPIYFGLQKIPEPL